MQAVILAGGSGTRFWPMSRQARPKQLLSLGGEGSLLEETLARLEPLVPVQSVWVCTTEALADEVRRQLPQIPAEQILEEPLGRNTAAAIGWSISQMPPSLQHEASAVLPADHHVTDPQAFRSVLEKASRISEERQIIMTLGVKPTRAETGYGYLELGEAVDKNSDLRPVVRFREKPDQETARQFLDSGNYLWNAGIFVFPGTVLLDRMSACQPEIATGLEEISRHPERLAELYEKLPAISIDHGVMEQLDDLGTLPLDCGWSDLGSWEALWEQLDKDEFANTSRGSVISIDSTGSLLVADEGVVAVLGIKDLVVVKTGDAVLVVPRERSQEVRRIVSELAARNRQEIL